MPLKKSAMTGKVNHRFERMGLRGLAGARDEFHLVAIGQNLKTLASYVWLPPPDKQAAASHQRAAAKPTYSFRAPRRAPEGNRP
jgi:hypothetical protein